MMKRLKAALPTIVDLSRFCSTVPYTLWKCTIFSNYWHFLAAIFWIKHTHLFLRQCPFWWIVPHISGFHGPNSPAKTCGDVAVWHWPLHSLSHLSMPSVTHFGVTRGFPMCWSMVILRWFRFVAVKQRCVLPKGFEMCGSVAKSSYTWNVIWV